MSSSPVAAAGAPVSPGSTGAVPRAGAGFDFTGFARRAVFASAFFAGFASAGRALRASATAGPVSLVAGASVAGFSGGEDRCASGPATRTSTVRASPPNIQGHRGRRAGSMSSVTRTCGGGRTGTPALANGRGGYMGCALGAVVAAGLGCAVCGPAALADVCAGAGCDAGFGAGAPSREGPITSVNVRSVAIPVQDMGKVRNMDVSNMPQNTQKRKAFVAFRKSGGRRVHSKPKRALTHSRGFQDRSGSPVRFTFRRPSAAGHKKSPTPVKAPATKRGRLADPLLMALRSGIARTTAGPRAV